MKYHTTKEGKKIKLADLELSHLENIIAWIERKAKDGLTVITGGSGSMAEDMWADADTYYGKAAKAKLNFFAYQTELERRKEANKISFKPPVIGMSSLIHHCGNELTEKEIFYDHCLKCTEYISED